MRMVFSEFVSVTVFLTLLLCQNLNANTLKILFDNDTDEEVKFSVSSLQYSSFSEEYDLDDVVLFKRSKKEFVVEVIPTLYHETNLSNDKYDGIKIALGSSANNSFFCYWKLNPSSLFEPFLNISETKEFNIKKDVERGPVFKFKLVHK